MVLKNPYCLLNSVDLSAKVRQIALNQEVDVLDATAGNSAGVKSVEGGLASWTVDLTFLKATGSGSVEATLGAAFGTSVPIEIRTTTDAVGVTNPKWSGNVLVNSLTPLSGSIGTEEEITVRLTGNGACTRAIA